MEKYNEINLEKIHNELIEGFARLEYEKRNLTLDYNVSAEQIDRWHSHYMNDVYFNAEIKSLVSRIMAIITNNIK